MTVEATSTLHKVIEQQGREGKWLQKAYMASMDERQARFGCFLAEKGNTGLK